MFLMVLLRHTCTTEIKEWIPSRELLQTQYVEKNNQPHMQLQNHRPHYKYDSKQHSEQYTAENFVLTSLYEN